MLSVECSETEQEVKEQVLALFVWTPFTLAKFVSEALHSIHIQANDASHKLLGTVNNRQIELYLRLSWALEKIPHNRTAQLSTAARLNPHGIKVVWWEFFPANWAKVIFNARALSKS